MSGWERRKPAEIQIGNGSILVTFDSMGEIDQVFAPRLDALHSQFGTFRTLIIVPKSESSRKHEPPELIALVPELFEARLRLLPGSQVIQAEYHHKFSELRLMRVIALHPAEPVLLDSWETMGSRVGLMHQSIPWFGSATSAHCSLYHPTYNGLVHHRGRRWVGMMARSEVQWVRVGHLSDDDKRRVWDGERIFAPVGAHDIIGFPEGQVRSGWDQVVQGTGIFGSMATGPSERVEMFVICSDSERNLGEMLSRIKHIDRARFVAMIEGMAARRLEPAADLLERIRSPRVRVLAERSIDVLHSVQDRVSGALMAAAEVDPHSRVSGGYGYSWPRDGAYLAHALGAFNFRERVEHYFRFCRETQDPSGAWWQRYLATGHAGPSWGRIQIDEPATVIAAAYIHYRRTQDLFWLEKFWPTIENGLRFLESFHSPENPMGQPSHDLWEERMGIHAYSLGAVAAAFSAGAYLAGELDTPHLQERYRQWNHKITGLITEHFVPLDGPIRRSFVVNAWDYQTGGGYWDEIPDVSLLGLITPFGIFRKRDAAAQRIVEIVRTRLWNKKVGGVLRYTGDHYRGGNPWILTTLWLAMVELSLGNMTEARQCLEWTLSKATSHGMLAEQVHRETGQPYWVIPLAWSHAMFLLFVRDVLDRKAESEIWESS